jgi:hypothetical protein
MKARDFEGLTIKKATFTERQKVGDEIKVYTYAGYAIRGRLNGKRVRKQCKTHSEALTEKERLEIEAANHGGQVRTILTRLTEAQIKTAETAFALTHDPLAAVQWYLANYKPPVAEMPIDKARDAFVADREPHVSKVALRDYKRTLRDFIAFSGKVWPDDPPEAPLRSVHTFKTEDVSRFLASRKTADEAAPGGLRPIGKKRFNNMRGDLNAFFSHCAHASRKWTMENPVAGIAKFKIARGLPEIITPEKAAELMAFLETYAGPERCRGEKRRPGCLVPYFALCLFAGLRPDVREGEVRKLADSPDCAKLINEALGVIRITPEISKVSAIRQVKIRPNLAAWLKRYPLEKFPIVVPNQQDMVSIVRAKFGLGDDVLRHTFISAHIAKWKSLGEAALEAGNSEAMIRKHYLNMLSEAQADAFWGIVPRAPAAARAAA